VDRLFRELPSSYVAIASALRSTIRAEGPALSETVKWNNPFWTGEDDVLCLQCFPDHVNLAFLRGAELSVAHPEIVGTGRAMRHVKIRTVREAKSATVRRLIRAAIELDSAH
jgi:hypothetical protein